MNSSADDDANHEIDDDSLSESNDSQLDSEPNADSNQLQVTGATDNESSSVDNPDESAKKQEEQPNLMAMAIIVEGGMIVLALLVGWFGFCDPKQSLTDFTSTTVIQSAMVWGLIATIPLLCLLLAALKLDWFLFRSLRKTIDDLLVPLFARCSIWEIALLSLLAGIGEELLFRWCLQGGLAELIGGQTGIWIAVVLVGIVFGLCHFITPAYALITAAIGIYLGAVMVWSGTYLAPALAHAFYDFIALLVIVRIGRQQENLGNSQ